MSNENPVHVNQLVVTFEGDDENNVSWEVQADDSVAKTMHASFDELARAGAPLSALGTRALFEMLCENLVVLALEKGNLYQCKEYIREHNEPRLSSADDIEGTVVNDIAEGVVIH